MKRYQTAFIINFLISTKIDHLDLTLPLFDIILYRIFQ